MKSKLLLLFFFFLFSFNLSPLTLNLVNAQVPQGFNYQAIARDGAGVIANQTLPVTITIQSQIDGGTIFYVEEHPSVTTNSLGLFTLVLGGGNRISGLAKFSDIDWRVTPKYIKTQIVYQSVLRDMGTAKMWSVPYSMVAGSLNDTLKKLVVKGNETSPDSTLFEVKNSNGQTVFAVYNEGVRIYVDNGKKGGVKGGFAIGGFGDAKTASQEYFIVNADSIRGYIYDNPAVKSVKGGFAIGGYGNAKGLTNDYLLISPDSTRLYVDNASSTKSKKGGFAIGGFDIAKGTNQKFLMVSSDSIRMYIDDKAKGGAKGGFAIGGYDIAKALKPKYMSVNSNKTNIQVNDSSTGFSVTNIQGGTPAEFMNINKYNYFIGHQSGTLTTPGTGDLGKYNSFFGYQTGLKNTTGRKNVYLGFQSGYESNTANYNVFIGNESGKLNSAAINNTFVGYWSGKANNGDYNTFIGSGAGSKNTTGVRNVYLGASSGYSNAASTSSNNVYIGYYSGWYSTDATSNVYLGYRSGLNNRVGDSCVFIGNEAGYSSKTSNKLYIANNLSFPPLIFGDFKNKAVVVNDTLPHGFTFYVNGSAGGIGNWNVPSDERLKKNISTITDPLEKIMRLRGVEFEWRENTVNDPGKHIGFIAQETINIVPEIVNHTDSDDYTMEYAPLTAILVEAVKQQQKLIEQQQKDISEIREQNLLLMNKNIKFSEQMEELRKYVEKNLNNQ